jgi:hypothetical protein
MERSGSKWTISGEDGNWELWVYDVPCEDASSCSARIPSWALAVRRALGDGSMQAFPSVATLVDHKAGVSLFNALTGAEWMSWPRQGFDHLGKLKTATFTETGSLVATFTSGALMLDFAADRVVLADDQGVALGTSGIAALGAMPFDRIVAAPSGESLGAPLYVSDGLVVWKTGFVWGKAVAGQTLRETPCAFLAAEGDTGLCADTGKIQTWRRSPVDGSYVLKREVSGAGGGKTSLIGGEPFSLGSSGLYSLASTAVGLTSLSFASPEIILTGEGHAFVRDESPVGSCRIVHLQQNSVVLTSFKESGLSAPCSGLRGVAVVGPYASISIFDGHQVKIQWIAP